jgi:hypothetical protein
MITVSLGEIAAGLVFLAALLTALGYLGRKVRALVHVVDAVQAHARTAAQRAGETGDLVARELEHNHGGSMKDDLTAVAYTVGNLWRRIDDIDDRLTAHLDRKARS